MNGSGDVIGETTVDQFLIPRRNWSGKGTEGVSLVRYLTSRQSTSGRVFGKS